MSRRSTRWGCRKQNKRQIGDGRRAKAYLSAPVCKSLPFARILGFEPLPAPFYPIIALIIVSYIAAAEVMKRFFYRSARMGATTVA